MFSHAKEIAAYRERRRKSMVAATAAYVVLVIAYTLWRATVFNPEAMVASWAFYLADVYGCLLGLLTIYCSWGCRVREVPKVEKRDYRVDVLLPVYTEPVEMIEMTVIGAKSIDYPHETWLLDDGRRDELKAIARKHGVHYLRRENNRGAKAGNLNHALKHVKGDLLVVFDADHVAQRESVEKLIGLMESGGERVGMVQAPQSYYNEDSFLYSDEIVGAGPWHDQAHFMDVVQASRDAYDGSSGIGTGVLYVRSAMDEIGGFPELTLTEDMHTSVLMHKRKMKIIYLNEPIAWGVAAADVGEYYKTRRRWAHGNLHVVVAENVLFCKGLGWRVRLGYLAMGWNFLEGLAQFLYLMIPPYCLLLQRVPFRPTVDVLAVVLVAPLVLAGLSQVAFGGYSKFVRQQVFAMGRMFVLMAAATGLFGKKLAWQVSLKNVFGKVSLGRLLPHFCVLYLSGLALVLALLQLTGVVPGKDPVGGKLLFAIASGWVVFNVWRSAKWIRDTVRLTKRTHEAYRFEARVPVVDQKGRWLGSTKWLSTIECGVSWAEGREPGEREEVSLEIPGRRIPIRLTGPGKDGSGYAYECVDEAGWEGLRRALYSVDWHRKLRLAKDSILAGREGLGGSWKAGLLRAGGGEGAWVGVLADREAAGIKAVGTRMPEPGTEVMVEFAGEDGLQRVKGRVGKAILPETSMPKCLNNNKYYFYHIDSSLI